MFSADLSTRRFNGCTVVALRGELDLADAVAVTAALTAVAARDPVIPRQARRPVADQWPGNAGTASPAQQRPAIWARPGDLPTRPPAGSGGP